MSKEAFPRHESGLVDFDCYLPYLPDHPDEVPIYVVPSPGSPVVHQHVYFQLNGYRSPGKTSEEGNQNPLSRFRGFSYNQILMRRFEEKRAHRDFEDHVDPPPEITIEKSLMDFRHLDLLAATSIGLEMALHPRRRRQYFPHIGAPVVSKTISRLDIADFFDGQREILIDAVRTPEISPQRVITSAIKRLSTYFGDARITKEADERLANDSQYYPLRMRHKEHFYNLSNYMLKKEFDIEMLTEMEADVETATA